MIEYSSSKWYNCRIRIPSDKIITFRYSLNIWTSTFTLFFIHEIFSSFFRLKLWAKMKLRVNWLTFIRQNKALYKAGWRKHRQPKLCGSSLDFEFIREYIRPIRPSRAIWKPFYRRLRFWVVLTVRVPIFLTGTHFFLLLVHFSFVSTIQNLKRR